MNAGFLAHRGVIVRHPCDFWPEKCATAVGAVAAVPGQFPFVMLNNNDALGRMLRVYSFDLLPQNYITLGNVTIQDGHTGTAFGSPNPLVSGLGQPPGQVYVGTSATQFGTPYYGNFSSPSTIGAVGAPFIVLSRGWSLILWVTFTQADENASFLYMID